MSSERKNSRLPPPAFPPGIRRKIHKNSTRPYGPHIVGDAFISPDEPFPRRRDQVARAFISPDEPLPPRPLKLASAGIPDGEPLPPVRLHLLPDDEGVVTGMGSDPHLDPGELVTGGDPHVMEVAHAVSTLADALRRRGEAGLHATAGMSRLEATLRAYCVGYVAGRRAEDEDEQSKLVRRVGAKAAPEL